MNENPLEPKTAPATAWFEADLLEAWKLARYPKAEHQLDALRRTGLIAPLMDALAAGSFSKKSAERILLGLQQLLSARKVNANDIKTAILAMDDAAQRFALAAGEGSFQYPLKDNPARDLLTSYASALHR